MDLNDWDNCNKGKIALASKQLAVLFCSVLFEVLKSSVLNSTSAIDPNRL